MSRSKVAGPRNAGIYTRISKWDGEGESPGVRRQEADCRAEAKRRGWHVVDVFTDDDKSAFSGRPRPQYVRLCDDLKSGRVDAVIVWDVDRLHRSPRELEDFVTLIEATGALVVSCSGGDYDLETADGRFTARIMGAVARKESEDKSRRLRRKHVELAEQGRPNGGRRPMGYRRVGLKADPEAGGADTRTLAIDAVEGPIVREVIERVATGQTLTRIAQDLNGRGATTSTGAPWTLWAVRRTALNGIYAARRMHNDVDVGAGTWPAIVDEATWRRAVALLNAPDRPKRRSARRYLLTGGIIVCGRCGQPMRSRSRSTRGKPAVASYSCTPPSETQGRAVAGCGGVSIVADAVEQLVAEAVIDLVESPAFVKALRARSGGDRKAGAEVTRIQRELDELENAKRSGALSLREYLKFRDATVERLTAAHARMAGDTQASAVGRFAGQRGSLQSWWHDAATTLDQRQAVMRAVVDRVTVAPVGKANGRFDPSRVTITFAV
jgi:DNA invertase Pin-like site-specific DNA recombinase